MKQILLFVLPPLLFLVAGLLPLRHHKPVQIAFLGLVPLYSWLMWQLYPRVKKPHK